MDELIYTLKTEIISRLNLEGLTPEDIDENAPLFGPELGLDSIDFYRAYRNARKKLWYKNRRSESGKKSV